MLRQAHAATARLVFARDFLIHPAATGSLVPSSRFLVQRMLRLVDWQRADVLVELGPGTGCFTREILRRMRPEARLIALELNPKFAARLRRSIRDPRATIRQASAAEIVRELERAGVGPADGVVSSLPFLNMPAELRMQILRNVHASLRAGCPLVMFQYRLPLLQMLHSVFGPVHREYEPLNLPPAHVLLGVKRVAPAYEERP